MHRRVLLRLSGAVAAGAAALGAQEPDAPDAARLLADFRALPAAGREATLERIEARLLASDLPALQRIRLLGRQVAAPGPAPGSRFHDPQEFAPVAPARRLVPPTDPRHRAVRALAPPPACLRDLHPGVVYDWSAGRPAHAAAEPTVEERFARLAAGYPPLADAAVAALLARLDRDGDQRTLAVWFEHLYADRDGRVFAGIRLYDAWYSGQTVEVPDVDAIAFARRVLHTQSFVSPIPAGRRRDRLYRQIKDAFARHREYRTLREAAAAAFVSAAPDLDPTYQPLVPRLQLLWADCAFDVDRCAARLDAGDRNDLLAALDDELAADGGRLRGDAVRQELAAMAQAVRRAAAEELAAAARR